MPSSYSPLLRLEEIGAGEQSGLWGETTNKNLGTLIEQAIAGVTTVALSGAASDVTLESLNGAVDQTRSAVLKFIGSPSGAKNIIIPTSEKLYVVRNDCGQTIVVKTAAQTGGVTILTGEATLVFCDGTIAAAGIATAGVGPTTVSNGGTGATGFGAGGFIKSPGTTGTLTAQAAIGLNSADVTGTLPVISGGTGATGFTSGGLLKGAGGSAVTSLVGTVNGQVCTWDGVLGWQPQAPASAGITAVNGSATITATTAGSTSTISQTSGQAIAALGFTPYNATNPSNFASTTGTNTFTAANTFTALNTFNGGITTPAFTGGGITPVTMGSVTPAGIGINCGAYNFTAGTSIYRNNAGPGEIVIANGFGQFIHETNGNFVISGSVASKASGTTWANPSDARIKDKVTNYSGSLSQLMQVQPKTWEYNGKGGTTLGTKGIGVIADEIQNILPNTVGTYKAKLNPDDTTESDIKQFDATEITWLLVNSVKELKAELDQAKAEIAALKAKA